MKSKISQNKYTNYFFIVFLVTILFSSLSCTKSSVDIFYTDPFLPILSKKTINTYKSFSKKTIILSEDESSKNLYDDIDNRMPHKVLLSPLLSSEIVSIKNKGDEIKVFYIGNADISSKEGIYTAKFDRLDAANLAGAVAAKEQAIKNKTSSQSGVVAVLVDGDETIANAFIDSFIASGGYGEPLIELSCENFSKSLADKLAKTDIELAYITIPQSNLDLWIDNAFSEYTFIIAENPIPQDKSFSRANVFISWDIEKTLTSLFKEVDKPAINMNGFWKVQKN